jgi:hypothetical protein
MKSEFLKQLSLLLIPNKETDYIDVYKLQNIPSWPLFTIAHYNSENEFEITPEKVSDTSKYTMDEIDFLGLEYSEIVDFNENELIIDAGGEFQGLHRIIISLDNDNKLYVKSCEIIPELSEDFIESFERHSEEEYEILLEKLQITLEENQD